MRSRSLLLAAGACLATVTLTMGTAAADPPTPPPQFGHPPCTVTSSSTSSPTASHPTPDVLAPTGTSSASTPLVSTPTRTATTPTATTTANCVTLFTTPQGNSAHVVQVGPDGNLWFPDGNNIVRMLLRAPYTQTDFPIPGGGPFGITSGPDGNIWFVQQGQQSCNTPNAAPGQVGRILTHAPYTVTEFPVPGASAIVEGIATGGDGNIWFTRRGSAGCGLADTPEIDRIVPHAPYTITQFPLPAATPPLPANAGPFLMVADAQGNLWFNFLAAALTGEISAYGSHQITLLPTGAGPLTRGPRQDPNSIWFVAAVSGGPNFTAGGPYSIGRIDTITHAVTTYPVTMTGVPSNIGAGPDGNIWVTETRTEYAIGRFQTHAPFTFSEIPLPDDTYPISVTCAPDGNEWFSSVRFPSPPDNPQGNPAVIGRVNLTAHDGLPGLSDVIGGGVAGDLGSLLGGLGHGDCPAPPPGIFPHGR
ncbi:MAG: hypothetical protein JO281_19255 [Pseudonocardiales bacterium]|nr:hypothetical protein [Pseudonocardiales bacterium]